MDHMNHVHVTFIFAIQICFYLLIIFLKHIQEFFFRKIDWPKEYTEEKVGIIVDS